jgi:hypothetical protein
MRALHFHREDGGRLGSENPFPYRNNEASYCSKVLAPSPSLSILGAAEAVVCVIMYGCVYNNAQPPIWSWTFAVAPWIYQIPSGANRLCPFAGTVSRMPAEPKTQKTCRGCPLPLCPLCGYVSSANLRVVSRRRVRPADPREGTSAALPTHRNSQLRRLKLW